MSDPRASRLRRTCTGPLFSSAVLDALALRGFMRSQGDDDRAFRVCFFSWMVQAQVQEGRLVVGRSVLLVLSLRI